jgi:hypothetical protein
VTENSVWIANHKARLRITPTTAALIPDSAADSERRPRRYSA